MITKRKVGAQALLLHLGCLDMLSCILCFLIGVKPKTSVLFFTQKKDAGDGIF